MHAVPAPSPKADKMQGQSEIGVHGALFYKVGAKLGSAKVRRLTGGDGNFNKMGQALRSSRMRAEQPETADAAGGFVGCRTQHCAEQSLSGAIRGAA
jgi:hypothetical protein